MRQIERKISTNLKVEVDDFNETAGAGSDGFDHLAQGSAVESLGDAAGIDGAHGIVRAVQRVTLHSTLHGDPAVEDDIDDRGGRERVGNRGEGRILAERVSGERAVALDDTVRTHILECCLFGDDERDLSELGGKEKTVGVAESILEGAEVDVGEERKRLDIVVLVHGVVGHVHVSLTDGLALDTTRVDGLLLWVVLDDLDDLEAVDGEQVSVGALPYGTSGRRVVVQIHAHTRLLRALAGEGVEGTRLSHLGGALKDLFAAIVGSRDMDDKVAIAHTSMLDLDRELARKNHAHERDAVPGKQSQPPTSSAL